MRSTVRKLVTSPTAKYLVETGLRSASSAYFYSHPLRNYRTAYRMHWKPMHIGSNRRDINWHPVPDNMPGNPDLRPIRNVTRNAVQMHWNVGGSVMSRGIDQYVENKGRNYIMHTPLDRGYMRIYLDAICLPMRGLDTFWDNKVHSMPSLDVNDTIENCALGKRDKFIYPNK
ncbi:uncharacterized protein LOC107268170 [Cephus cinctus]|uniref:Uncharacterized protein LOC107268170 n=1 Tax=Cephus cinctus TaxID=211228 RepID=A0AAJ7FKE2_CEPCN|nr:uncharacterized protein LOC107268170 [Cephus cinctus]